MEYILKGLDIHHVSVTGEEIVNNSTCGVVTQWCDHRNLRKGGEKERSSHDMAQTMALIHPTGKTATLVMLLGSTGPWCASCWPEMMALLQSGSVDHE